MSKCDCCGKVFPVDQLKHVTAKDKEFDGAACKRCEHLLKTVPADVWEEIQ